MIPLLLFLFHFIFCKNMDAPTASAFPYQVNMPDKTLTMSPELTEISGVSVFDANTLVAVQDENGIIFYLNKNTGKIERQVKFWEDGDYEDLQAVGKTIYVVKSTGTIYEVPEDGKNVQKYNFGLSSKNDVEGLAYDATNRRLLLACKNKAGIEHAKDERGIYAFDLNKKTLSDAPVYTITSKEVQDYLNTLPSTESKEKLSESFESEIRFAPSAIAVHPRTSELYLLSAAGKVLLVLNADGKVAHLEKLKKKIHLQPEGICFDPDGTMYLSNEGKDGAPGKIYVFKMK